MEFPVCLCTRCGTLHAYTPFCSAADDPESVIVGAARRLDQSGVPARQMGVQFAQIGDDEDATEALRELDEGLAERHGIRVSARRIIVGV
jgi:hypothetical protein